MHLANYLNKLIKEDGFILLDANSNNYVIGNPKKQNPIKLKILDKSFHYKLGLCRIIFWSYIKKQTFHLYQQILLI